MMVVLYLLLCYAPHELISWNRCILCMRQLLSAGAEKLGVGAQTGNVRGWIGERERIATVVTGADHGPANHKVAPLREKVQRLLAEQGELVGERGLVGARETVLTASRETRRTS
jgi:hypothetical protein